MKALEPETSNGRNPGETLRNARESNGWSQADVAIKLNLTVQALGYLETGAFDKLPGNTFARGYIRAYAKLLGVEQQPLVSAFDHLTGSNASGSSVHALGRIEEPAHVAQKLLRVVSFVLLLGLALASYFWWQDRSQAPQTETPSASVLEHIEVDGADGTTQIHPLDEPEDQAVNASEGEELALPEVAADVAAQPEISPVAVAPQPVSAPVGGQAPVAAEKLNPPVTTPVSPVAPSSQPPVAASGEGLVSVKFSANCWAQLTDANGKILFSALKRSGETLELAGKPPLELRLGYARGAVVSYNGQVIDVAPYTSGETARIKLGL